jgi:hypothetical protein
MDTVEILVLRHCIPPLVAGLILGITQKYLFLRNRPRAARWWPVVTGVGAFVGTGFLYSLAVIISFLDPDQEFGLATLVMIFVYISLPLVLMGSSLVYFSFDFYMKRNLGDILWGRGLAVLLLYWCRGLGSMLYMIIGLGQVGSVQSRTRLI